MIYGPEMRPGKAAWQDTFKAAEEYNDPGRFTAFIGYEGTFNTGGNKLHRDVIFLDNGDKADQVVPYTTMKPLGSDKTTRPMEVDACLRGQDRRRRRVPGRPRGCQRTNSTRAP
jgi:Protein of unknown function (DUF3604)